jgi:hypothetical protein
MRTIRNNPSRRRRGAALLVALVVALVMAGLCTALLSVNLSTGRSRVADQGGQRSFYAAEAGLSDAYMQLTSGLISVDKDDPAWVGTIGSPEEPRPLGSSSYWVEMQLLGSRGFLVAATGADNDSRSRLGLVLGKKANGFFQWAAFGADGVVLDSNSFIDSYDSALGTYESQVKGGNDFARENGHVGSNGDILVKSNTEIHGDARPGPGHVVNDSAPGTLITGSTEPLDEPVDLPPIEPPDAVSLGDLVGTSAITMGPGLVRYDSILMKGGSSLTIKGPAQLVVDDFMMNSNTELIFDTSNGKIELYANYDFVLESNSKVITSSTSAVDVTLLLDGNNMKKPGDTLKLGSNADFVGAIYAPNGQFSLDSNFTVYGSIMCRDLDLSSFGEIHYDEALLYDGWGATDDLEPRLWQRLALQP